MHRDKELATLNIVSAMLNVIMLPWYAYIFWEVMVQNPRSPLLIGQGFLLLINVVLCFGFLVGVRLWRDEPGWTEKTLIISSITQFLLIFALLSFAGSPPPPGDLHWFLHFLEIVCPVIITALLYCILVPVFLLRTRRASRLYLEQILTWADEHHVHTGNWPRPGSAAITGALGETWADIDRALRDGLRGLPGNDSLKEILRKHRGIDMDK